MPDPEGAPPPPWIVPLKVVEPPLGLRVRTDAAELLLMMLPPLPGVMSDNEATCWLPPLRSNVLPPAIDNAVVAGKMLPEAVLTISKPLMPPLLFTAYTRAAWLPPVSPVANS